MGFANRGDYAEDKVHAYLKWWAGDSLYREASRLTDTKAAGRIIKAAKADFEYFSNVDMYKVHGLIEVKQTKHEYRLERAKLTQLPALRKREKAGGQCIVVIYFSEIRCWRAVGIPYLVNTGDKGSWDMRAVLTYPSVDLALRAFDAATFPEWTS